VALVTIVGTDTTTGNGMNVCNERGGERGGDAVILVVMYTLMVRIETYAVLIFPRCIFSHENITRLSIS
jgi:hypothetical protein